MATPKTNGAPAGTPDSDEIAYRCRNIQRHWTEAEERKRRTGVGREQPYELPTIAESVLFGRNTKSTETI